MSEIDNQGMFTEQEDSLNKKKQTSVISIRFLVFVWAGMILAQLVSAFFGRFDLDTFAGSIWFPGWIIFIAFMFRRKVTNSQDL